MTLKKALLTRYVVISIVVVVFFLFLMSGCAPEHSEVKKRLINILEIYNSSQSVDTIVHEINADCTGIPSIFFFCDKSGDAAHIVIACRMDLGASILLSIEELTFVTKCTNDVSSTDQEKTS